MRPAPRSGRYRCLVIDHDDTAVRSTPEIHHPAYCTMLRQLRPGARCPDLVEFFLILQRGLAEHLRGELGFSREEMREEYRIWKSVVTARVPSFYPGFVEILRAFRAASGLVAVVSHSDEDIIRRDYGLGAPGVVPDAVYGWNEDEDRRKPSAYPLLEIMERWSLGREELLVVDDLRPGVLMARRAGVDAAAAGWAHSIPEIEAAMRRECTAYLATVSELARLLGLSAGGDSWG